MPKTIELQITESEKAALITALPLTHHVLIPNSVNAVIYELSSGTALEKLMTNHFLFSAAEIRTISLVTNAAVSLFSGQSSKLFDSEVSISEWKSKLAPHYFSLRKLAPIFDEFCNDILR